MKTNIAASTKAYQHTQPATLILRVTLGLAVLMAVVGWLSARQALIAVPILLLSAWLFNSLTIEIAAGKLHWRFGPGLIRKQVALADIVSVKIVRTNFLEGWGIHLSRFGWLYNASGWDAVAITLRNGKRFALGTDEPDVLAAHINQTIQKG